MADIIVRQANTTSLTIQSSSNQVIVRQQPNNTVVVQTTGNSYVLPPATANTLGGIIVGDNLTINANGLLSATAGAGVSTFNNRTGNVTLTANDVISAAVDAGKTGSPQIYVRTSTIPLGCSTALANYPANSSNIGYVAYGSYIQEPLFNGTYSYLANFPNSNGTGGNIYIRGGVTFNTAAFTNPNPGSAAAAASVVGTFSVLYTLISDKPLFQGTNSKSNLGFQLEFRAGVPFLNMKGGMPNDSWLNFLGYPDTYILTKGQLRSLFLTREMADLLYEPLKRVEPPLELP